MQVYSVRYHHDQVDNIYSVKACNIAEPQSALCHKVATPSSRLSAWRGLLELEIRKGMYTGFHTVREVFHPIAKRREKSRYVNGGREVTRYIVWRQYMWQYHGANPHRLCYCNAWRYRVRWTLTMLKSPSGIPWALGYGWLCAFMETADIRSVSTYIWRQDTPYFPAVL